MIRLKEDYKNGKISKEKYITEMYKHHNHLYEYAKLLPDTNIKRIVVEDNTVYMETRDLGIKLACRELDERSIPIEMFNFNNYEEEEWNVVNGILEIIKAETVFDIGANIGYVSIFLSKKHENMSVHAFEPVKMTFDMLTTNLRNNDVDNVTVHNIGLSDKKGEFTFFYYPAGSVNASMTDLSGREDVQEVLCHTDTLDAVFADSGEKKLDFVKCDVEGAELMALKGGEKTIARCKPVIFAELLRKWAGKFGYVPNDVIDFLKNLDYQCYCIRNGRLKEISCISKETVETNFIFLHKEKHDDVRNLMAQE